jgi:hypothetical protein
VSDRQSYQRKLFSEAVAPYSERSFAGPHTKLSISLPTDLVDLLRASAKSSGLSVSATIAACVRQTLGMAEQASLDRALELDAEENIAWATAYSPVTIDLLNELEW